MAPPHSSTADALRTMPMAHSVPAEPSGFLLALLAHAERSARTLEVLGVERA